MDQIEERLKCGICLDRYRRPKMLPCQHTFCLECLAGLLRSGSHQFTCPECRANHYTPPNGASGFPTSIAIQQFLDLSNVMSDQDCIRSQDRISPSTVPPPSDNDSRNPPDPGFVVHDIQPLTLQPALRWVFTTGDNIPPEAFVGGNDHDTVLYVGRAQHEGSLTPGKVQPDHGVCYIAWGGKEHGKHCYEILVGTGHWVRAFDGNLPSGALGAGRSEDGEELFVGRAEYNGTITIGKVQRSHGSCYIPYDGKEIRKEDYEVLTQ